MKFHLLGLLVVASVMVNGGHGLKCHQCVVATSNEACNSGGLTQCLQDMDTCTTTVTSTTSRYSIVKTCITAAACAILQQADGTYAGVTKATTCCKADGCNANAAARLLGAGHLTVAMLGLGLSIASRALV